MPPAPGPTHVALLRGINVGGKNRLPMARLRAVCAELGWRSVTTYVQSGNVVFTARGDASSLSKSLSKALRQDADLDVPVVVRPRAAWLRYANGGPFPDAGSDRPNLLHLALAAVRPPRGLVDELEPYCRAGERVAVAADALWIDYRSGVGRSKLTTAVLDRVFGSPVTARNWRSVQAIAQLLSSP